MGSDEERRYFDSANFVVLYIRCEALEECLREEGLSTTQLGLLLKLEELGGAEMSIQGLADLVHVQPNVVTQAANGLERRGFAKRRALPSDGRSKYLVATAAGERFLETMDVRLYAALERLFLPEGGEQIRDVFDQGLRVGAQVGKVWSDELIERFPSVANLVSVAMFLKHVERTLRAGAGVTLSEARTLQRLKEEGAPMRVGDLATQLRLPAATITRAAAKLERSDRVVRLVSPHDKKAAYFDLTDGGRATAEFVDEELNRLGNEQYWGSLSESDLRVTDMIKQHILRIIAATAERERENVLASLESAVR